MNNRINKFIFGNLNVSVFISLLAFLFFSFPTQLQAQTTAGITVIPPKFELFANPGEVVNEVIRVRNESDSPVEFAVFVEDFSSAGEEGRVVLEEGDTESSFTMKKWIETSTKNILLQPGEEKPVGFTISIPRNSEPGGHYASVIFQIGSGEAPPEGAVATVQHRIGSLVLLRVSGDVVEKAEIQSFTAPSFSTGGPVTIDLRLRNDGTTHVRPNGTLIITNILGAKVEEIPLDGLNVFPGAVRKMTTEWEPRSPLGIYTATLVSTYGQQNLPITAATRFVVASPVALVIFIVGSLALIVFVLSLISGRGRVLKAIKMLTTGK